MSGLRFLAACGLVSLSAIGLVAPAVHAQVVQLPTYSRFSLGTTVVVPDGGTVSLGGVRRGAWGSSSSGVPILGTLPGVGRAFRNRSIGSTVSSSAAAVTATIIDHAELDRQVLAEAAAMRGGELAGGGSARSTADREVGRRAAFLTAHVGRRGVDETRARSSTALPPVALQVDVNRR